MNKRIESVAYILIAIVLICIVVLLHDSLKDRELSEPTSPRGQHNIYISGDVAYVVSDTKVVLYNISDLSNIVYLGNMTTDTTNNTMS